MFESWAVDWPGRSDETAGAVAWADGWPVTTKFDLRQGRAVTWMLRSDQMASDLSMGLVGFTFNLEHVQCCTAEPPACEELVADCGLMSS